MEKISNGTIISPYFLSILSKKRLYGLDYLAIIGYICSLMIIFDNILLY